MKTPPHAPHRTLLLVLALIATGWVSFSTPSPSAGAGLAKPRAYLPLVTASCCQTVAPTNANATIEAETLRLINAQRLAHGLAPLANDDSLVKIARFHSQDMAIHNITSHDGSAGEAWSDRFAWTGMTWQVMEEVIGWGYGGSAQQVVTAWMNSPTHRSNILDPAIKSAGVGYYADSRSPYGSYWTVDMGALMP